MHTKQETTKYESTLIGNSISQVHQIYVKTRNLGNNIDRK